MAASCRRVSEHIVQVIRRNASLYNTSTQYRRIRNNILLSERQFIKCRTLSTTGRRPNATNQPSEQKPKDGIIKRIAIKSHHFNLRVLNRISPKARGFYERFVDGTTSFVSDFRHIYSLNKKIRNKEIKLEDIEWKDLYMKLQMKQDVSRVFPALVLVNIPFVYYVTLPFVLYFQRKFLSDHFIAPDQVAANHAEFHHRRRQFYPEILQCLDKMLTKEPVPNGSGLLRGRISEMEEKPLSTRELLDSKAVFSHQASLKSLSRSQLKSLCKLHSQWVFLAPGSTLIWRLSTHATFITLMDKAVVRAGLDSIEEDYLRKLCNQRGYNPVGSDREALTHWLVQWTQLTTNLTDEDRSLLLHASVLLVAGRPHQADDQSALKRDSK